MILDEYEEPTIGNKIFSRFFTSSILGSIGIDNSHHSEIEYLILAAN